METGLIARTAFALALLASLGTPAAAAPKDAQASVKSAIHAIYARYRAPASATGADDEKVYSSRTRALIARWHAAMPDDEVTTLGDFDWFCQCQDFDDKNFAVTAINLTPGKAGSYLANVRYAAGWGSRDQLVLVMVPEGGGWKVDDIRFGRKEGVASLRAGLADEIRRYHR